ncbi:MAG: hypothetical protein HOK21_25400 [Rhodospirillaceae bacterium]|jgi:hypothetical protein|nr:hypothetical protein [Rhodospirillaceae bacterium]MBT5527434.1 hypothetical protein [Rhodospirillaceae bacterium]MBT5880723.1 hypothetical protein [Rhodospirillaceae bacterium]MBT6983337.1 hypothetical protein [Rhodospirillaceae bacterium]
MPLIKILPLLVLINLVFSSGTAVAKKVYWGGVGFISWEDRDQLFPYSSKLLCRSTDRCPDGNIDLMARPYFEGKTYSNFDLSLDLIDTQEVEGTIMAPMIARETIGITQDITDGKTSFIHVYRIFANLMFFEFGTGRFIASRPVVLQYTDTMDHPASSSEQFSVFSDLLANETRGENIFKRLHESAQDINPLNFSAKYVQITEVNLGKTVREIIARRYDPSSWKAQIGQIFEANIVKETGAPLIPSMGQSQLGGELMATFKSSNFKIILPEEPAFRIALDIKKFKRVEKVKGAQKTVCHAVSIAMRISSLLDEIINVHFRRTIKSCGVVHVDKALDQTFYFPGSLLSLLNQVAKQFGNNPDKGFLKEASPRDPQAAEKIKRAKQEVFYAGL